MNYVLKAGDALYLKELEHDMISASSSLKEAARFTKEQAMELALRCGRYWWVEECHESEH